jgi:hypothetical protein
LSNEPGTGKISYASSPVARKKQTMKIICTTHESKETWLNKKLLALQDLSALLIKVKISVTDPSTRT